MFLVYYEDLFHYASAATITAAITAATGLVGVLLYPAALGIGREVVAV